MKYFLSAIFFCLSSLCLCASARIDSLFAAMPRTVLPILDNTAKLDLLDLYNNKMKAVAENLWGGQTEMVYKNDSHIRLLTSPSGEFEIKRLVAGRDTLALCITTVKAQGASSTLALYAPGWRGVSVQLPQPDWQDFWKPDSTLSSFRLNYLYAQMSELPCSAQWDDTDDVLRFNLSVEGLPLEDRDEGGRCVRPVWFRWADGKFVSLTKK